MTYNSVVQINSSDSLRQRVSACAAEQGNTTPTAWANANLFSLASDPQFGWGAAWDSAVAANSVDVNPDTGIRDDVISDAMILSAVQSRKASQGQGTLGWPAAAGAQADTAADSVSTSDSTSESATAQ